MRLRRYKKMRGDFSDTNTSKPDIKQTDKSQHIKSETIIKQPKPVEFLRKIISNPNFNYQLALISLVLLSDNVPMDRHLDGLTTTVDKIRNVTEIVSGTMNSLKSAAEAPRNIRRLLE